MIWSSRRAITLGWLHVELWCLSAVMLPRVSNLVFCKTLFGNKYYVLWHCVTPGFKTKIKCSSYLCPGSSCHTYIQNVNTENHCLYYKNFITWNIVFTRRLGRVSHWAVAKHTNPTSNRPGATLASRRILHRTSPSHLQLLSSITRRVSRLMVATQQVKEKIQ
jgi:hypothetical protein